MSYRKNDAPDTDVVKLSLSFRQMRLLDKLVNQETAEVEWGNSNACEKTLHSVSDALWKHLLIELTPEEEAAKLKPFRDACRAGDEAMRAHMAASRGEGMGND